MEHFGVGSKAQTLFPKKKIRKGYSPVASSKWKWCSEKAKKSSPSVYPSRRKTLCCSYTPSCGIWSGANQYETGKEQKFCGIYQA